MDLATLVRTHLFVISPNNSGSTFVTRALETCREVWRLPREGQHMLGYEGPDLLSDGKELIWAADPEYLAAMRDHGLYDWEKARKAWYFQARAHRPDASVFVTKAPPFLIVVDQLRQAFPNARFVFLARNPYAVIEAICRYHGGRFGSRSEALATACSHILTCLTIQRDNIGQYADICIDLTYEELCAQPAEAALRVRQMVPELHDLDFDRTLAVKGQYNERLRDMNADQIARLSASDIAMISERFSGYEELLGSFGYGIMGQ